MPLLLTLVASGIIGAAIAGVVSPYTLRLLAQAVPFNFLATAIVLIPSFRRRAYAEYVRDIRKRIDIERRQSLMERYSALPASVSTPEHWVTNGGVVIDGQPANTIIGWLTDPRISQRAHVLIESQGGRGKSALLRQVVSLALDKFEDDPKSPLPVFCDVTCTSLDEAVFNALGRYALDAAVVTRQVDAGEFFLVIDNLHATMADASKVESFMRAHGTHSPILAATRPCAHYHEVFERERTALVDPQQLTDATLPAFVQSYQEGGRDNYRLREEVTEACKGVGGTYLPLLVRLATLVDASVAESAGDICAAAVEYLLGRTGVGPDVLQTTASLCARTYGRHGGRIIALESMPTDVKELLTTLMEAGVVVPAESCVLSPIIAPREVRFFHDTVQSYLAARGLFVNRRAIMTHLRG